jgi:hypothetical protein
VDEAPKRLSQGPNDVQPPHGKRPRDQNHLEGVSREIGLASVKLSPFAGVHNLAGVSNRGRPVEALAECVAHEGARGCVVATHARVDVSKELTPLGDGYASL